METFAGFLLILVLIVVVFVVYFTPSFVAYRRKHTNFTAILVLNICLGWTLVGWVVALVWAYTAPAQVAVVKQDGVTSAHVAQDGGMANAAFASVGDGDRACPFCAEMIKAAAVKCRFCHSDVPAIVVEAPPPAPPPLFMPKVEAKKPLAPGDMECKNCKKHIPMDATACAWCGHRYKNS